MDILVSYIQGMLIGRLLTYSGYVIEPFDWPTQITIYIYIASMSQMLHRLGLNKVPLILYTTSIMTYTALGFAKRTTSVYYCIGYNPFNEFYMSASVKTAMPTLLFEKVPNLVAISHTCSLLTFLLQNIGLGKHVSLIIKLAVLSKDIKRKTIIGFILCLLTSTCLDKLVEFAVTKHNLMKCHTNNDKCKAKLARKIIEFNKLKWAVKYNILLLFCMLNMYLQYKASSLGWVNNYLKLLGIGLHL